MSAAAAVLPYVWAFAFPGAAPLDPALPEPRIEQPAEELRQEAVIYRPYTEALLRRYVKMSMEAGKVPSLIGQEMFRGNVTTCRVGNFDDVVIFLHDVDHCLEQLESLQQKLVRRLALEQYTVGELRWSCGWTRAPSSASTAGRWIG